MSEEIVIKVQKAANGFIAILGGETVIAESPFKLGAAIAAYVSGEKVNPRQKRGPGKKKAEEAQ